MSVLIPVENGEGPSSIALKQAIDLLDQQIWCWGRDILLPNSNFLLEVGFQRIAPPLGLESCSSVYTLRICEDRSVVLRGFGVFFGDRKRGGVFLPRYEFWPRYTPQSKLVSPPWRKDDLPSLKPPSQAMRTTCAELTLDLLDWIRSYEVLVAEKLGAEYRRDTLLKWDNGKRNSIPAVQMPSAWRALSLRVAADFTAFVGR